MFLLTPRRGVEFYVSRRSQPTGRGSCALAPVPVPVLLVCFDLIVLPRSVGDLQHVAVHVARYQVRPSHHWRFETRALT